MLDFGEEDSHDLFDLLNSKHILLWGKNVVVSSPHTVPMLKESAARKVLIDPVWHRTARLCEGYVHPRPGGGFALAVGGGALLCDRGWPRPAPASALDPPPGFAASE